MSRKPKSRAYTAIAIAILVVTGGVVVARMREPKIWHARLAQACLKANRVIVDLPEPPADPEDGTRRLRTHYVDVWGADKMESLLDAIELKPNWLNQYLMRPAAVVFRICQDEEVLASVSYHRGSHLRWRDERWPGDAFLTESSMAAIDAWLAGQGIALTDP